VPRRVAPTHDGKARPFGPSRRGPVFMLRPVGPKVEARRAEGRGPKGRGEIFGVVNLWENGSELDSGSPHVITP